MINWRIGRRQCAALVEQQLQDEGRGNDAVPLPHVGGLEAQHT